MWFNARVPRRARTAAASPTGANQEPRGVRIGKREEIGRAHLGFRGKIWWLIPQVIRERQGRGSHPRCASVAEITSLVGSAPSWTEPSNDSKMLGETPN